jgi:transcriptional antiterminator RfaH
MLQDFQTSEKSSFRWYVVHTQPGWEDRAGARLMAQGYQVFCPHLRKLVRHARKTESKLVALFPGYLFLWMDASRMRWRSVNGTRGVIRLLTQGDTPQPLASGIVENLQSHVDAQGALTWIAPLSAGQRVRIVEGPFEDFVGTLERLDGQDRVHVLLDLLGRSVPATLRYGALAPAA